MNDKLFFFGLIQFKKIIENKLNLRIQKRFKDKVKKNDGKIAWFRLRIRVNAKREHLLLKTASILTAERGRYGKWKSCLVK